MSLLKPVRNWQVLWPRALRRTRLKWYFQLDSLLKLLMVGWLINCVFLVIENWYLLRWRNCVRWKTATIRTIRFIKSSSLSVLLQPILGLLNEFLLFVPDLGRSSSILKLATTQSTHLVWTLLWSSVRGA